MQLLSIKYSRDYQKCSACAKQNKTARLSETIWSSFLLSILIKAVISLYAVWCAWKSWKSKFWNGDKYKWNLYLNEIAHVNLHPMNNVIIKFIKASSFLEILQNSQENTYVRVFKKETLAQVFSCEFCEISKNTFCTKHLWTTASEVK